MERRRRISPLFVVRALALVAAVLYNSWPLGYWLDPAVSFHGGIASELQSPHQPYYWLFDLTDTMTAILVFVIVYIMRSLQQSKLQTMALSSFALFGICTLLDALIPMPCDPSLVKCADWSHQPLLLIHGAVSIGAALSLFASIMLLWYHRRAQRYLLPVQLFLGSWVLIGLLTLVFFFVPGPEVISQDYYLVVCGIWIALLPALMWAERDVV